MIRNDELAIHADRIFAAALEVPTAQRAALLSRECGQEPELLALVERLLAGAEGEDDLITGGGLAGPLWQRLAANLVDEVDLVGSVVERYRVVREIGRGGMAVVYLAERADSQFDQQVALKLIKRGTDTDEVVHRFRQERQIMARTQHPNIARLLDGGSTRDGRPYFVMEHVVGRRIDHYCDEERLTVRQRLELFLDVARAVAHAHRNLVVHRDIKPSNIMVTDEGEVKLLDFGIAKFLNPEDPIELTRSQMRLMTPAYASPEQVRGVPVTTASDIYQLGLLLYLLITGRSPYRESPDDSENLARAIREVPPTRPSTVIAAPRPITQALEDEGTTADEICEQRQTTPVRLRRELGGDIDNIVLMTLRKEPERRYASTAQLIDDIERYLAGRPVAARPSTLGYRVGKFVRRNAVLVASAFVLLAVSAGLIGYYTVELAQERDRANQEAERASREAAVATEVSDFLVGLFEVSDPGEARGNVVTAREILDRGAERIESELAEEPLTQARLMTTIGIVYRQLGLFEPSASLLEGALGLREKSYGPDHSEVAGSLVELGILYRQLGRYAETEALYLRALPIIERDESPQQPLAEITNSLAQLYMDQGKLPEAEVQFLRSLELLEERLGPEASEVAILLNNLALLYRTDQRPAEAEPLYQRALPIMERHLGADHPHVAILSNNLALVYRDQKKYALAEPLYERSLAILRQVVGPEHPQVAVAMNNLADLKADQGAYDEAEPLYLGSLAILEKALGEEHPNVATSLDGLADLYAARAEFERAEPLFVRCLAIREKALGPKHARVGHSLESYADLLRQTGRSEEAERLHQRALAIRAESNR